MLVESMIKKIGAVFPLLIVSDIGIAPNPYYQYTTVANIDFTDTSKRNH